MKINRLFAASGLLAALLVLAGCSVAPEYKIPSAPVPAAFKESGNWKPAEPSEQLARGQWWRAFGDEELDSLVQQAADANQSLQAATARLKQARAMHEAARAGLFPTMDANIGPSRVKPSSASQGLPQGVQAAPQTLWKAQMGISYEVDLFGRVAASVDAASADTQRSEALFRSVQLALQADVSEAYFTIRALDTESTLFQQTVDLREQALALLQRRFEEGEIDELDVARATSELETARSDALAVARLRAASEHGLAVLLGKAPAEFTLAPAPLKPVSLRIPPGLPSSLLERRPDIAAAERAMAAANARVGVAKAAYFPSLSLNAAGGFEAGSFGELFKWSSRSFALGPLAGALSMPLFDGGRRSGELAGARARYEEDVANYRQQVLQAFREVEDNLSELRYLEEQTVSQAKAGKASDQASRLAQLQYSEGAVNYLDVIDAERSALQSRRAAAQLQGSQAVATVRLVRALGGGWQ
jgi:multidrug efflux system outer membrane protein